MSGEFKHTHGKDPRCLEVFEHLSEYLDGELDAAGCEEIERHIADCPPCVEFLRSLRRTVEAAHDFKAHEAPSPMPPELEQRLKEAWTMALELRRD